MQQIATRIREERERLGLNQTDFASLAGATRKTLFNWENGVGSPSAEVLSAWSERGVDVAYIVLGSTSTNALTADEQALLALFRAASLPVKMAALGALQGASATKVGSQVTVKARGGNAAGRDMHIGTQTQGGTDAGKNEGRKSKRAGSGT